jgi:hypothetical protein
LVILAFAAACGLGSVYGFLQGAWTFGLAETISALVATYRWNLRKKKDIPGLPDSWHSRRAATGHFLKWRIGVQGGERLRDFCVTQWCFVVLSGAKFNGRHAASD